jgi:hypothetical protein
MFANLSAVAIVLGIKRAIAPEKTGGGLGSFSLIIFLSSVRFYFLIY